MEDFSIESLYEMGLGLKTDGMFENDESYESFENSSDIFYQIAIQESLAQSLEIYKRMFEINAYQKNIFLNKIKSNYGYFSNSLENFCDKQMQSVESDSGKKEGIVAKIIHAIAKVFRMIWYFILSIPVRIRAFIKHIKEKGFKGSISSSYNIGNLYIKYREGVHFMKKVCKFDIPICSQKEFVDNMFEIEKITKLFDAAKETCDLMSGKSTKDGIEEIRKASDETMKNIESISKNMTSTLNNDNLSDPERVKILTEGFNKMFDSIDGIKKSYDNERIKALDIINGTITKMIDTIKANQARFQKIIDDLEKNYDKFSVYSPFEYCTSFCRVNVTICKGFTSSYELMMKIVNDPQALVNNSFDSKKMSANYSIKLFNIFNNCLTSVEDYYEYIKKHVPEKNILYEKIQGVTEIEFFMSNCKTVCKYMRKNLQEFVKGMISNYNISTSDLSGVDTSSFKSPNSKIIMGKLLNFSLTDDNNNVTPTYDGKRYTKSNYENNSSLEQPNYYRNKNPTAEIDLYFKHLYNFMEELNSNLQNLFNEDPKCCCKMLFGIQIN